MEAKKGKVKKQGPQPQSPPVDPAELAIEERKLRLKEERIRAQFILEDQFFQRFKHPALSVCTILLCTGF